MTTVIIADDEEFVREFLKTIVESIGYKVIAEASTGNELIDIISTTQADLLLLDINMPTLSGVEFLEKYSKKITNTCVIMMTAVANTDYVRKCLILGAKHFIRKDTPVEKIVEIISTTYEKFENVSTK